MMMAMDNQLRASGRCQLVDDREAVPMTGRRFVRHQHIELKRGKPADVIGKDRIPMPQWQSVAPGDDPRRREKRTAVSVPWRIDPSRPVIASRIPDRRLEHTWQARHADSVELFDAKPKVADRIIADEIVVRCFRLRSE